jgi:preprotein translocase subunit SecA
MGKYFKFKKSRKNDISISNHKNTKHLISKIKTHCQLITNYSDGELRQLSSKLKAEVATAGDSTNIMIEAYALVYETCIRKLKITPYDVQLIGAVSLHSGKIIEMPTGEGKTLTAVFPAFLNALSGKGVHVLTFNDYLAVRDAKWMSPILNFLGLSVGYITGDMENNKRKEAYNCDITYTTAKNVGFDYLSSSIAYCKEDIIHRPFHYAIVDEADAILIDEARNPLVLSGEVGKSNYDFAPIAKFVSELEDKSDFDTDEFKRNVYLTEKGINKAERLFQVDNLFDENSIELLSTINLSLQARVLLKRNVDYIVRDNKVLLVDEFTGRIVSDRKWKDGLQLAVEAKEKVKLQADGKILTMITMSHFFEKYNKVSGMTATASESSEEFHTLYNLEVVTVPSNKTCLRVDEPNLIFASKSEKYDALLNDVQNRCKKGQPILIGTLTVDESEQLAQMLRDHGISCKILNAKNDALEAEIISEAGKFGAVTISTNMAGRGTDILLGGKDASEKEKVVNAGGLYVISTNLHESSRIDNQLRGRAGRQGDIGSSQFYISYKDDLMCRYNLQDTLPKKLINARKNKIEKTQEYFSHTQRVIEGQMNELSTMHYEYSSLIEKQRKIHYDERQAFLDDGAVIDRINSVNGRVIEDCTSEILVKARNIILFQYDKYWSQHIDYISEVKEGIHLLRYAKQNPLREFQKYTDTNFKEIANHIDFELKEGIEFLLKNSNMNLEDMGIKKPSSTWTYIINDNPFENKYEISFTDSSYLGF